MTLAPSVKGWCPTLLSPMQSGDGWLARVKPRAGTLSAEAARVIADGARHHGNSHIDLTSRANLQIRGLTPNSAEQFADAIIAAGLANPDPVIEQIRNILVSPLGPDDATAAFDSHALARELEAALAAEPALRALPHKFGFLVDSGGVVSLAGTKADIMLSAHQDRIALQLDGSDAISVCPRSACVEAAKALALAFVSLGFRHARRPARMRALVMAIGAERVFAAAQLKISHREPPAASASQPPIGYIPYANQDRGMFGVGLPFGRIDAASLAELATLSERFGDATLRLTPWRAILIPSVAAADAASLVNAVRNLGLIVDADDPRLSIFACPGKPACRSASVDARADASRLAASGAAGGLTVHVSGCAKSCAHRGSAAFTLVGRDGAYDLVLDGGTSDAPIATGLGIDAAIALIARIRGRP